MIIFLSIHTEVVSNIVQTKSSHIQKDTKILESSLLLISDKLMMSSLSKANILDSL